MLKPLLISVATGFGLAALPFFTAGIILGAVDTPPTQLPNGEHPAAQYIAVGVLCTLAAALALGGVAVGIALALISSDPPSGESTDEIHHPAT